MKKMTYQRAEEIPRETIKETSRCVRLA